MPLSDDVDALVNGLLKELKVTLLRECDKHVRHQFAEQLCKHEETRSATMQSIVPRAGKRANAAGKVAKTIKKKKRKRVPVSLRWRSPSVWLMQKRS